MICDTCMFIELDQGGPTDPVNIVCYCVDSPDYEQVIEDRGQTFCPYHCEMPDEDPDFEKIPF